MACLILIILNLRRPFWRKVYRLYVLTEIPTSMNQITLCLNSVTSKQKGGGALIYLLTFAISFPPLEYPKLCLIQYLFNGVEHTINVPCHGNVKKGGNPYTRTKPSVIANLRSAVKDQKPKAAYHKVEEMAGGIMNVDCLSDLPRNRDQVSYLRRGTSEKRQQKLTL